MVRIIGLSCRSSRFTLENTEIKTLEPSGEGTSGGCLAAVREEESTCLGRGAAGSQSSGGQVEQTPAAERLRQTDSPGAQPLQGGDLLGADQALGQVLQVLHLGPAGPGLQVPLHQEPDGERRIRAVTWTRAMAALNTLRNLGRRFSVLLLGGWLFLHRLMVIV